MSELVSFTFQSFNISHEIKSLSFGNTFPGITNPLDNVVRKISDGHGMYQYYLKLVPTTFQNVAGEELRTHQYSVSEHMRAVTPGSGRGLPGVFLYYEMSPIHARLRQTRKTTAELATSLCAIVGGVYTAFGVFDMSLHAARRRMKGGYVPR